MALQQASLGGKGLKGATADLQGMSSTSAEKKVLEQGVRWPCATKAVMIKKTKNNDTALELESFMFKIFLQSSVQGFLLLGINEQGFAFIERCQSCHAAYLS